MRNLFLVLALANPLAAQSVFNNGVTLHSGSGQNQKTKPYEFKGPYVLQWSLRDLPPERHKEPTWRPTQDKEWDHKWVAVEIFDAVSGRYLYTEQIFGRDSHYNVPEGGKHYLRIKASDHTAWILQAKEGRAEMTDKGPVLRSVPTPEAKPTAAKETVAVTPSEPAPAAPATPPANVPEPKPSSVPGLPPGVEPAQKAASGLPPGMTKGAK